MIALIPILALAARLVTVYVSPSGSDDAQGSQRAPFQTLTRAMTFVRSTRRTGTQAVIHLAAGDYPVVHPLELQSFDGKLEIEGERGARLLGGVKLTDWKPVADASVLARLAPDARSNVLECPLPEGVDPGALLPRGFGVENLAESELFFDHEPMTLARWPAVGSWLKTADAKGASFAYVGDEPSHWAPSDDVWCFGYFHYDWADIREHVYELDPARHRVALQDVPTYGIESGRRFYFFNILEEVRGPGDWYLDRKTRTLYFWPPSDPTKSEALVSVDPRPLVDVKGASEVTLKGLTIEGGRSSAVQVTGGSKVRIEDCIVRNCGGSGINIDDSPESGVSGCKLTGLGEHGIALNGGDRKTLKPAKMYAEDNEIWATSRWVRTYQPAIALSGVGNRASHNSIHDLPHQAISVSGNDHLIEFNDIQRACTETGDAGAIYMGRDTSMRGTMIRYNRFRDIGAAVGTAGNYDGVIAVYLDDCYAGTTIFGNIFEGPGIGVMIGGGRDNTVQNNVFLNCNPAIHFDARGKGWASKFFDSSNPDGLIARLKAVDGTGALYTTRYPGLKGVLDDDPAFPKGNTVADNVCSGGQWISYLDNLKQSDLAYRDNVVNKATSLDEAMKAAPPGFKPIPITEIGPRPIPTKSGARGLR